MNLEGTADSASRFAAFVGELTSVIGHADRARPLNDCCAGLLVSEGRRSVEPMAAVTAPAEVSAQHQKLLHFVANAPWADKPVLAKVREMVMPAIERHGPIKAWIVDDTSFPKYGSHSVGVHHQYCGQLGKKAHVPKAIAFKTKPQISLEQIREACAAGVPRGVVLTDASYGSHSAFRTGISVLGLKYVAAIVRTVKVRRASDRGAPVERLSVKELALSLPKHAWRTITWREGTNDRLRSRFARVRVHASPTRGRRGRPEETLLIEWPEGEPEPTKYWLATVDENISFRALVDLAKMRWRIERDYQELKQEIGLGHYEGRGWPGFHHHGTLCIAAYGFLISERERIPPSEPHSAARIEKSPVPSGYRPRGAPDPAAAPRPQFDRHNPPHVGRCDCNDLAAMPVLPPPPAAQPETKFMTQ